MEREHPHTVRIAELHRLFEDRGWRLRLDLDRDGTAIARFRHRTAAARAHEVRAATPVEAAEAAWHLFLETLAGEA